MLKNNVFTDKKVSQMYVWDTLFYDLKGGDDGMNEIIKMTSWRDRYGDGGICDFKLNYDFYFKWLTNKVMQIFVVKGLDGTKINGNYLKSQLILDGTICITDYEEGVNHEAGIYAVTGNLGGEPDEYYIPVIYTCPNPILGSKQVYRKDWNGNKKNGVVIFNTDIDNIWNPGWGKGLYDLISQTATLLADNIVSINCQQINSRVQVFFTADGEAQAIAGEAVLKRMYAGSPYQILRSDLVDKLTVNPISGTGVANNITQLVELQNFIIANFFQSIGVKGNNVMKRERLIEAEIDEQNDMVALSLLECVTAWEKGFREVNEMYGTDIHVELNPVLIREIADQFQIQNEPITEETVEETSTTVEEEPQETDEVTESTVDEEETVEETEPEETVKDQIEELEEVVQEVIDTIIDDEGGVEEDVEEPGEPETS